MSWRRDSRLEVESFEFVRGWDIFSQDVQNGQHVNKLPSTSCSPDRILERQNKTNGNASSPVTRDQEMH